MAKTCNCPNPPGGIITCSDDQLAMCGYRDGQIVSGCFDPPPTIAALPAKAERITALSNWALQHLTGEIRAFDRPITSHETAILLSGTFTNERGERYTFVLPAQMLASSQGGATKAGAA